MINEVTLKLESDTRKVYKKLYLILGLDNKTEFKLLKDLVCLCVCDCVCVCVISEAALVGSL